MKTIKKSSPALLSFYRDWLEWAEADAPEGSPFGFTAGIGLCSMSFWHAKYSGHETPHKVESEINRQFRDAGKSAYYPFGEATYYRESENGTIHKNPKRLAWVMARIEEAGE